MIVIDQEPAAWRWKYKDSEEWGGTDLKTPSITQNRLFDVEPLYPASALTSLMEENAELKAALDAREIESGLTRDGNLWRFWSQKAKDVATKLAAAEARAQAAEQRVKDAVKVLEPFAAYIIPDPDPNSVSGERFGEKPELADFRAARRLIKEAGE